MSKQQMFVTDMDFMCRVYELAKSRGKKAGDSIEDEFIELMKQGNEKE